MAYIVSGLLLFACAGGTIQFLRSDDGLWLVMLVPFCCLFFLVAPYSIWKKANDDLLRLMEKRLIVEVPKETIQYPENEGIWSYLLIRNNSGLAIQGCYGQLTGIRIEEGVSKGGPIIPPQNLSWSAALGGVSRSIAIGPGQPAMLDIGVAQPLPSGLRILTPAPDNQHRSFLGMLSEGTYVFTIQVGSEVENFQPSTVSLRIVYKNQRLDVSEVKSA